MTYATVAIITRTKDRPLLLRRAIESAADQSYKDWRMTIVNDGGDAAPVDALVAEYAHLPITVIHNPQSLGMEAASNVGIRGSESKYVIIHDDDDSWHPTFLQRAVQFLETDTRRPWGGVVCYIECVKERVEGTSVTTVSRHDYSNWIQEMTLWRMCAGNFFPPISFLYKREAYEQIGGMYREDLPVLGDWEFNLRFLQRYDIGLIPEILAYYHHRVDSGAQYGNTVTVGEDKHALYNGLIRNEKLREDMEKGVLGLGYMMNVAHSIQGVRHLTEEQKLTGDHRWTQFDRQWQDHRAQQVQIQDHVLRTAVRVEKVAGVLRKCVAPIRMLRSLKGAKQEEGNG